MLRLLIPDPDFVPVRIPDLDPGIQQQQKRGGGKNNVMNVFWLRIKVFFPKTMLLCSQIYHRLDRDNASQIRDPENSSRIRIQGLKNHRIWISRTALFLLFRM